MTLEALLPGKKKKGFALNKNTPEGSVLLKLTSLGYPYLESGNDCYVRFTQPHCIIMYVSGEKIALMCLYIHLLPTQND